MWKLLVRTPLPFLVLSPPGARVCVRGIGRSVTQTYVVAHKHLALVLSRGLHFSCVIYCLMLCVAPLILSWVHARTHTQSLHFSFYYLSRRITPLLAFPESELPSCRSGNRGSSQLQLSFPLLSPVSKAPMRIPAPVSMWISKNPWIK